MIYLGLSLVITERHSLTRGVSFCYIKMNSKVNFSLVCLNCGVTYKKKYKYGITTMKKFKFCSHTCYTLHGGSSWYQPGHKGLVGKSNSQWKGDKCSYNSLHCWVKRWIPKPKRCTHCGKLGGKHKSGKSILEAANISGKYLRDLSDWVWVCTPCHSKLDRGRNSIKEFIKAGRRFDK